MSSAAVVAALGEKRPHCRRWDQPCCSSDCPHCRLALNLVAFAGKVQRGFREHCSFAAAVEAEAGVVGAAAELLRIGRKDLREALVVAAAVAAAAEQSQKERKDLLESHSAEVAVVVAVAVVAAAAAVVASSFVLAD